MASKQTSRLGSAPEEGVKAPVVAASTENLDLEGLPEVDGVQTVAGDRVLVGYQTDASENGIYNAAAGTWSRSTDFNADNDVINGQLVVDANTSQVWSVAIGSDFTMDSSDISFTYTGLSSTETAALALALNVQDSEVIYSTDTSTVLDDVLYIYSAAQHLTYEAPELSSTGETITSLTVDQLITSADTYTLTAYDPCSTLKTIALSINVLESEVVYSINTETELDDVLYIYDSSSQVIYVKPSEVGASETIVSLSGGTLTTSGGSYSISVYEYLDSIATNTTNITTNTTNITTNAANITTNASGIATNAANIATNASDIATLNEEVFGGTRSVTGTATFTNSTQNISLTGIGDLGSLENGDVLQVTDSLSNNTELTVEDITDSDNVVVNYEHRGQATSKALTDETATAGVTVTLLSKWYNAPIGLGQDWCVPTSGRTGSTDVVNSTNRTIGITVRFQQPTLGLSSAIVSGGAAVSYMQAPAANYSFTLDSLISPGETYSFNGNGATVNFWYEKR